MMDPDVGGGSGMGDGGGRLSLPFLSLSAIAKLTRARRSPSGSASGSSSHSRSRSRSFSSSDSHFSSLSRSRSFTSSFFPSRSGSSRSRSPPASTQKTQVLNLIRALTSSSTLVFFLLFIYFYCKKIAKGEQKDVEKKIRVESRGSCGGKGAGDFSRWGGLNNL
ncbi:hypothetical protein ACFXTH_028731 [Malus domestica]